MSSLRDFTLGFYGILDLRMTNGTKSKQEIIKKLHHNEWFINYLYYSLNPMLTYNVTRKSLGNIDISEYSKKELYMFNDIFECCGYLARARGINSETLEQVKILLAQESSIVSSPNDLMQLYIDLLSKKPRLGVTAHTVNKIIPGFIPEWDVQQSFPIEKYPLTCGTVFWVTQKLNGVRATFFNGRLLARSGVPYTGLDNLLFELNELSHGGMFVLDGELTLKDKGRLSDNEAFRVATGILNSDEPNKSNICFTVFDVIPVDDFISDKPTETYSARRSFLDKLCASNPKLIYTRILPVMYHGTDQSIIPTLLDKMVKEDKEGLMINLDVPYYRKRHRGILKVKRFYTADLEIVEAKCGDGKYKDVLGALVVKFNGNEVSVGSGFSDEQRQHYWEHKDELIGKICEVKYKEISYDKKTGMESLQFPVFIGIRYDKETENVEV